MTLPPIKFQIGKNGINQGVFDSLTLAFKNHKQVRVNMLKSSGRDRNSIENMATEIVTNLGKDGKNRFGYKIIGFTIILNKHTSSKE